MPKVTTVFYEDKSPIHSIETDYPLSIAEDDTVRIHSKEPSEYSVDRIHHELTISGNTLSHNEVQIHLIRE